MLLGRSIRLSAFFVNRASAAQPTSEGKRLSEQGLFFPWAFLAATSPFLRLNCFRIAGSFLMLTKDAESTAVVAPPMKPEMASKVAASKASPARSLKIYIDGEFFDEAERQGFRFRSRPALWRRRFRGHPLLQRPRLPHGGAHGPPLGFGALDLPRHPDVAARDRRGAARKRFARTDCAMATSA